MRTRTAITAALLLGATAAACGGSDSAKPGPTVTVTKTVTPAAKSAEPSPSSATYAFGTPWEFESTDGSIGTFAGTVTVLGYKQGVASVGSASQEAGASRYVWAYADLKLCVTKGSYNDDNTSWTLYYSDGSRVDPSSSTYDDFPKPEFPIQVTVTAGKCARGKLVFPVPGGKRPESVLYSPPGLDQPTEWTVPKA
ncbi:hypothetical protein ABZ357_09735 [Streptomyces sp. NPDC005917]|uniref:hypothetical protein n=1 Tax=unclassified Streptomyces TaxID=2593676 RepID=UPI0033EECA01